MPNDLMQPEDGDPRDDAGGGETAMPGPHVVRLVVERLVPYEEVDASLVYGWPQLLLPVEGAGGAGAGRGSAEADKEQPSGELTLGAVSQVRCTSPSSPDAFSQFGLPLHMPCPPALAPKTSNQYTTNTRLCDKPDAAGSNDPQVRTGNTQVFCRR